MVPQRHPKNWVKGGGPGGRQAHRRALSREGLSRADWGPGDEGKPGLPPRPGGGKGPEILPSWGDALFIPSLAESPQLGLEVRAPGLQPMSPVVTNKGTGGAGAAGSQARVGDRILTPSEAGTAVLPTRAQRGSERGVA